MQHFESFSANVPIVGIMCPQGVLFTVLWFKWQWKHTKVRWAIWEIFLNEKNHNYHYTDYRFSCYCAFILVLPFLCFAQKQESGFQQVDCLVMTNVVFVYSESHSTSNPYQIQ